jgi:hypothetical protein
MIWCHSRPVSTYGVNSGGNPVLSYCHSDPSAEGEESWGGYLDADSIGMTLLDNIVETLPLTGATLGLIIAENKYGVNKFY